MADLGAIGLFIIPVVVLLIGILLIMTNKYMTERTKKYSKIYLIIGIILSIIGVGIIIMLIVFFTTDWSGFAGGFL